MAEHSPCRSSSRTPVTPRRCFAVWSCMNVRKRDGQVRRGVWLCHILEPSVSSQLGLCLCVLKVLRKAATEIEVNGPRHPLMRNRGKRQTTLSVIESQILWIRRSKPTEQRTGPCQNLSRAGIETESDDVRLWCVRSPANACARPMTG